MIMKVIRPLNWSLWLYQSRNYSKTACSPSLLHFHGTNGTIIVMRHRALFVGLLIDQHVKTFSSEMDYKSCSLPAFLCEVLHKSSRHL
jgi:hypothetical protein